MYKSTQNSEFFHLHYLITKSELSTVVETTFSEGGMGEIESWKKKGTIPCLKKNQENAVPK